MSANNYANKEQLIDLLQAQQVPVLGAGGGFAPIGTINFFDASVAPQGWLACDGTVYNIADYPDLATYYASVHGSTNFYGGNGTTTFAIPDLRGEFLRGTGTNSHTNQGSGENVGVHQDGTVHPITDNNGSYGAAQIRSIYPSNSIINADSTIGNANGVVGGGSATANLGSSITSRPTNTSFLICVKATVAGDANAHQYSTEEQVIGKWIDGSDIYERTVTGLSISMAWNAQYFSWIDNIDPIISNVGKIINSVAYCVHDGAEVTMPITIYNKGAKWSIAGTNNLTINSMTIQYTKTQS